MGAPVKLHIGEDGAALFDEEGRRVATLSLFAFATPMECRRDDGRDERRLALARQFAASQDAIEACRLMVKCLDAGPDANPLEMAIDRKRAEDAAREALRKAGRE